jgi:hypothetical protein
MKFGLLEDGSFIDIRRLSPEALIGIDIYEFDITNVDEFDFDLINVENSLPIEGGHKDFFNHLKYYVPGDLLQDSPILLSEISVVILNTVENPPTNNNPGEVPDSYVYVPKYDLYFKPDGTNFVDSSVKARIFAYIFNRDGFIEYEGGFIPVRLKNSIGHPGFPLIDQFPPDNNVTECKGLVFDHPSGRTNKIPCANFYNRLKYTTDTTNDINTIRQEIAKAIANR